jgi:hypothetical protein
VQSTPSTARTTAPSRRTRPRCTGSA